MLQQRLADTLGESTLHLAFRQHGVDEAPVVVDRDIAQEIDGTRLGIDLDLGDMTAVREGEHVGDVEHMRAQPGRHAVRQVRRIARTGGEGREVDAAVAAAHREATARVVDLSLARLKKMRGQPACLRQRRIHRLDQRRATHVHRARAAMAGARPHGPRIGLHVSKGFHRQTEMLRGDLGEGGLVPLPVRLGTDGNGHPAVRIESHLRALVGCAAGGFQETGNALSAQAPSCPGLGSTRLEVPHVPAPHGDIEAGHEVAGVDGHSHRGPVRKGGDQVLPPQVGRRPAEGTRRRLDGALDDVVGLGLAGPAIGIDRRRVGERAAHVDRDRGNVVEAALRRRGRDHRRAGSVARQVGAEIGDHRDVERKDASRLVERQPRGRLDVAALGAHHEILGAIGQPADRPSQPPRRPQKQDPFGIEEVLHAEAAADIRRMKLDALGRHLEDELGELAPDAVQPLPGQFQVHRVGRRIVARYAGARLQRHDDDAIVRHADLDDMGRFLHRLGDRDVVTALHVVDEVAGRFIPQERRILRERAATIDNRWQRLVVDFDALRGFARELGAVGHDETDRIADMADTARCQRGPRRHDHRLHRGQARHVTQAVRREIGSRRDQMHARHGCSGRDVDRADQGMGVRRPQDMAMKRGRLGDILDVAAVPREEPRILEAAHRSRIPACIRHVVSPASFRCEEHTPLTRPDDGRRLPPPGSHPFFRRKK